MLGLAACTVAGLALWVPPRQAAAFIDCESHGACAAKIKESRGHAASPLLDWAGYVEYASILGKPRFAGSALTLHDYRAFGGIGAVVCRHGGKSRAATAFLVGRFDVAVTVAHVFVAKGKWVDPGACIYVNSGPAGQIRELIPIASIKAQWQLQPETYDQPTSDLAVVRLAMPVQLAMRTLALTRFAHTHAPAMLVGYLADVGADALKRKRRGNVYQRPERKSCVRFTHDIDSRSVAPGAPIIDVRDNVVIGIHTRLRHLAQGDSGCDGGGNAMILMNSWLERTLRSEIESTPQIRLD